MCPCVVLLLSAVNQLVFVGTLEAGLHAIVLPQLLSMLKKVLATNTQEFSSSICIRNVVNDKYSWRSGVISDHDWLLFWISWDILKLKRLSRMSMTDSFVHWTQTKHSYKAVLQNPHLLLSRTLQSEDAHPCRSSHPVLVCSALQLKGFWPQYWFLWKLSEWEWRSTLQQTAVKAVKSRWPKCLEDGKCETISVTFCVLPWACLCLMWTCYITSLPSLQQTNPQILLRHKEHQVLLSARRHHNMPVCVFTCVCFITCICVRLCTYVGVLYLDVCFHHSVCVCVPVCVYTPEKVCVSVNMDTFYQLGVFVFLPFTFMQKWNMEYEW